jgi:hypothetical protein
MNAPQHFEDRLLEQLRQVVAERPALALPPPRRSRRARLALAGAGGAVAVVAVAIVASSGDVASSAYAVDTKPDGEVSVSIHSLADAAGLQSSLRAAGVPAVVDYVQPGEAGCVGAPPPQGQGEKGLSRDSEVHPQGGDEGPTFSTGGAPGQSADGSQPASPPAGAVTSSLRVKGSQDGGGDREATFSVDPGQIEPGQKLYITTSTGSVDSIGMQVSKTPPSSDCASR